MNKIKILFDQLNLTEEEKNKYQNLELIEVDVDRNQGLWAFLIKSPEVLLKDDFFLLDDKLKNAFKNIKNVKLKIIPEEKDITRLFEYYPKIIEELQRLVERNKLKDKIELCGAFCMGDCVNDVSVKIDEELFSVKPDTVNEFFENEVMKRI